MTPRASILIPTHSAVATLPLAVRSALAQTVTDIEVLVIGDGVDDAMRAVIASLHAEDQRVRFLDRPKAPNRGERNRDAGVRAASSDAIVYLCDDDLLLPNHVENVLGLLAEHPVVQSRDAFIDADESLQLFINDLGDPAFIARHLEHPPRTVVSITGLAHSRAFYLQLERGWEPPPAGSWPDVHLWRQFLRQPGFSGATHPEVTTLQFPSTLHRARGANEQAAMMQRWAAFASSDDVRDRMAALVDDAARRALLDLTLRALDLVDSVDDLVAEVTVRREVAEASIHLRPPPRVLAALRRIGRLRRR